MQFNPAAFNRHLEGMGQQVLWRQSFACPCTVASGQPDHKHQLCGGKGRLWEEPIQTVTGVAGQKVLAQWVALGQFTAGDAVLSVPESSKLWDAGQFDRITMLNATTAFSQTLMRGAANERLAFKPSSVKRVFWLDAVKRLPVEGGLPEVSAAGVLTWGADAPPPGMVYSITGERFNEYFLFDNFPSNRNQHSGMRLPKLIVARKFDLFGR